MKHGTVRKKAAEIDSLQAYFQFSWKYCKNFYIIWFVNLFVTPKLHFANPNGDAAHSLRSPVLANCWFGRCAFSVCQKW